MDNIDWKKKLFNELAYSHDDAYYWKGIIEDFDELNDLADMPSNKKPFYDPYWKNKLLYMIKYSRDLDYKKIYDKVTETKSSIYDTEINDYFDSNMFSKKYIFFNEYSDSSIDSSDDSSDDETNEDEG